MMRGLHDMASRKQLTGHSTVHIAIEIQCNLQ